MKMSLDDDVREYTAQLRKGKIQNAYKGILTFMSGLRTHMAARYPEAAAGGLYTGAMDMTYFALTPPELKKRNFKIAVVYLHVQNSFEVWLSGSNRKVQAETIGRLAFTHTHGYTLSRAEPGVDSILTSRIIEAPDFNQLEPLMDAIERKAEAFTRDILALLDEAPPGGIASPPDISGNRKERA